MNENYFEKISEAHEHDNDLFKTIGDLMEFITPEHFSYKVDPVTDSIPCGNSPFIGMSSDVVRVQATCNWSGGMELTFVSVDGRITSVTYGDTTYPNVIYLRFHEGDLYLYWFSPESGKVEEEFFAQFR